MFFPSIICFKNHGKLELLLHQMVIPSWKNMAVMAWSCHDHGMIIMFSMFFCWKNAFFFSIFSQIVAALYRNTAQLTGYKEFYAFKVTSQQNWTKNTSGKFGVFFCDNGTESFFCNNSFNIRYILQVFVIFSDFETLRERDPFLVNIILVVSDGFVQHILR